jgi:nitrate/nitrite transporter NarK
MFGFSYVIYINFFATFLVREMGWTHSEAGRLFTFLGFLSIFCGLLWGGISDVIGRKGGATLAYVALAISYGILPCSVHRELSMSPPFFSASRHGPYPPLWQQQETMWARG